MSNYLPWDPPHSPTGPPNIRPAGVPNPGFATFPHYPTNIFNPCVNTAQVPVPHPSALMGSSMTLPPAAPTLPFQRSEKPSSRSYCHNKKHMPVPLHQQRTPAAAQSSISAILDYKPQISAGPYNAHPSQGRPCSSSNNQIQAVARSTSSQPSSSPTDRTVKTAPVRKDMQSAQVTPDQDPGVPNPTTPASPTEHKEEGSPSPFQMSVDSSSEEGSVKVITSSAPVGPLSPTLKVELERLTSSPNTFKRSHSIQSDCYIVETVPNPNSESDNLVQKSVSPSPPRKLQKGNQEDE